MATVQGPNIPTHAVDSRKRARAFQQMPTAPQPKADPYYGHEIIARLCTRFITHLFACPEYPPTATQTQAKLPYFIAYALHRTKLHASVTFAALVLLQRLKARFPTARGSSGHRLFISAFMIASKVICDDTYSNKSWGIVAQGMFNLREINQMEREMCSYLDWELTVDNPILENFEKMVRQDFATSGPYPTYSLQMVSKRAVKAAASTSATPIPEPHPTTTAIPSFDTRHSTPVDNTPSYTARTRSPASPMTPDTPSYSNSTSPASSASPQTPVGGEEWSNPKIATVDSHPYTMLRKPRMVSTSNPSKSKTFAFAQPASW